MDLEDKLNKALKEQEKESYKARRNKHAIVAKRWNNILPWNYYKVISSFSEENLDTLFRCLSVQAKEEIWNYISNFELASFFKRNCNMIAEIFSQMPQVRKEKWLNGEFYPEYYMIFMKVKFPQKMQVIEMLSVKALEYFCEELDSNGMIAFCNFLLELSVAEECDESRQKIFQKLADLGSELFGKFFQEADADVVCQILQHMKEEAKPELCRNFHGNVYELLEKTDFALLNYIEEFPEWNFDAEEMQDFFYNLEEREINIQKYLSVEAIQAIYCEVKDCKIKEKILFNFLESLDMLNLYGQLSSVEDKMEMLEIMTGRKASGQYDADKKLYMLQNTIYILEETENLDGLNYFEELLLKDLKA